MRIACRSFQDVCCRPGSLLASCEHHGYVGLFVTLTKMLEENSLRAERLSLASGFEGVDSHGREGMMKQRHLERKQKEWLNFQACFFFFFQLSLDL